MQDYQEFVDKFKPKKTTDDCYTPPLVYEAVRDWAVAEYHLDGRQIVRPFYPGGNFEQFDYPDGCVVIDNPPFSILAKIKEFYIIHGIDFFLFAPHLTLFTNAMAAYSFIVANAEITYDNGAKVNTSFVTNLDENFIRTAPSLKSAVEDANKRTLRDGGKTIPKYSYPDTVISAALLGRIANEDFKLHRNECCFIRALDSQRPFKKAIFGNGFIISERRAAERRAAERRAPGDVMVFELSDREKEIVASLSHE